MYKQTDSIVNKTPTYRFTSSAFVLSPFAGSPLHLNQTPRFWVLTVFGLIMTHREYRLPWDSHRSFPHRLPCWICVFHPGLTSLALMSVVTIPTERSAIMKVVYKRPSNKYGFLDLPLPGNFGGLSRVVERVKSIVLGPPGLKDFGFSINGRSTP